ncbi:hypothetical protein MPSEU_000711800 [Mayamaea pseudoterrestris]|nr:hypothetical protein MPSEU_000711800 [Mayamaea pseudoterrestris]
MNDAIDDHSAEEDYDRHHGTNTKHVNKRQRGWQGEHLELEHAAAARQDDAGDQKDSVVAVDLNQFRNTVVGQGYQAKHVIRQKGSTQASRASIVKLNYERDESNNKKRKSHRQDAEPFSQGPAKFKLQTYLECPGLRKFRKELAKIEASH